MQRHVSLRHHHDSLSSFGVERAPTLGMQLGQPEMVSGCPPVARDLCRASSRRDPYRSVNVAISPHVGARTIWLFLTITTVLSLALFSSAVLRQGKVEGPEILGAKLAPEFRHSKLRSVVVFLRPGCSACSIDLPVYRALITHSRRGAFSLAFVNLSLSRSPQPLAEALEISSGDFIPPDRVGLGVGLTPTIVLATPEGDVEAVWAGGPSSSDRRDLAAVLDLGLTPFK